MKRRTASFVYLLGAVLVTTAPQHARGADSPPEILPVIARAAGDNEAAMEKALDELADMGATGMARIGTIKADTKQYTDKQRRSAALAYNRLTDMAPGEKRNNYRTAGEKAFTAANYALMARKYARLAVLSDANVDDCLWNGHARQLAGNWRSAVEAYKLAYERIEDLIDTRLLAKAGDRRTLVTQRAALILLIGRILRHECNDPAAAATVFASASNRFSDINRPLDRLLADCITHANTKKTNQKRAIDSSLPYIMQALLQAPVCMEQIGQHREAFDAWTRAYAIGVLRDNPPGLKTIAAMARLLARLDTRKPARKETPPLPRTPWLIMLTPDSPWVSLKLDQAETKARSFHYNSLGRPRWRFAICPPPGKEFATVTFACDIEQFNVRYGGDFSCSALVGDSGEKFVLVGDNIRWTKKTPGREVIKRTFNIPAATRMLSITTGWRKDYFKVWEVKASATFRPAAKPAAIAKPTAGIQQELLPAGGKCTRNGKPHSSRKEWSVLPPGRYIYTYAMRGKKRTYRAALDLKPNGRYGLFVNLESPFTQRLTDLTGLSTSPSVHSDTTLVKLPDGRWLATYGASDGKIMLATSKDLAAWTKPWALPVSSFFRNLSPTVLVDTKGVIHLAYFSNRLNITSNETWRYRLWMMHSKDARTWSAPRIIHTTLPNIGGHPAGAIHMFRTPDGQYRIHWRNHAAAAKSPSDFRGLKPINITLPKSDNEMWNPHLAVDPDGKMHMVYDNNGAIFYTHSTKGDQWSPPVCLVGKGEHNYASHPIIVRHAGRSALIYSSLGAWLKTGSLTDATSFTPAVKIAGQVAPLNGSRPYATPKGDLIFLTGRNSVWTMRASLSDIFPKP
ncbi:MAG: sialidase family protein [Phycisphaerae bacterium]|jgi:hypothetical protein|nr:sialidase family protein [Phycisphaerae bacterium]